MKNQSHPEDYYFNKEDWPLMQLSHTFAQASIWLAKGMDKQIATFELTVREMPNRNYLMMCGVEEMLNYLQKIRFSKKDINHLRKIKLISPECAEYLKNFKFTEKKGGFGSGFWDVTVSDIVKYLQSSRGEIIFDFKIKGDMNNPRFYPGPHVKQALQSMVIDKVADLFKEEKTPTEPGAPPAEKSDTEMVVDLLKGILKK